MNNRNANSNQPTDNNVISPNLKFRMIEILLDLINKSLAAGKVFAMGGGTLFGVIRFMAYALEEEDGLNSKTALAVANILVLGTLWTNVQTRYWRMSAKTLNKPENNGYTNIPDLEEGNPLNVQHPPVDAEENSLLSRFFSAIKDNKLRYGINAFVCTYAFFSFMSGVLSSLVYAAFIAKITHTEMDDESWKRWLIIVMGLFLGASSLRAFSKYNWDAIQTSYIPDAQAGKWFKKEYKAEIIESDTQLKDNYSKPTLVLSHSQNSWFLTLYDKEKKPEKIHPDRVEGLLPALQNCGAKTPHHLTPVDREHIKDILKAHNRNEGYPLSVFAINGVNVTIGVALAYFGNQKTAELLNKNFLSHLGSSFVFSNAEIQLFSGIGVASNIVTSIVMNLPANDRLYKRTIRFFKGETHHEENYASTVPEFNGRKMRFANDLANLFNSMGDAASVAIAILVTFSNVTGANSRDPFLLAFASFGALFTLYNIFSLNGEGLAREIKRRHEIQMDNNPDNFPASAIECQTTSLLASSQRHHFFTSQPQPPRLRSHQQQITHDDTAVEDMRVMSDIMMGLH